MGKLKNFWNFLKKDTWTSWIVSLVLLIILIRFIVFPTLSLITGSPLPLVVVESCSMYHDSNFNNWWEKNGILYAPFEIDKTDFNSFTMKNGFSKGDIIMIWGYGNPELGDIIIFEPNHGSSAKHPIIHRIVSLNPTSTKGDNNPTQLSNGNGQGIDETNIPEDKILGRAVFKIPVLGWIKLIFFELFGASNQPGICR
jgi:signal peptidase I